MANNIEFNVVVSGLDGFQQSLVNGSKCLGDFAQTAISTGREISRIGEISAVAGAAITGPLLLAFKDAAAGSAAVTNSINSLTQVTDDFQKEIAVAMIPVVNNFTELVSRLFNAFNSLSPSVRTQVVQTALLVGGFLAFSGIVETVIGKIIILSGELAKLGESFLYLVDNNPELLITYGIIIAIVAAMVQWQPVADTVLNTLETGFNAVNIIIRGLLVSINLITTSFLKSFALVVGVLEKLPLGQAYHDALDGARKEIDSFSATSIQHLKDNVVSLNKSVNFLFTTGQGTLAKTFQSIKQEILDIGNLLSSKGSVNTATTGFFNGFSDGLDGIGKKLGDMKQQGIDFANTLNTGFSTALSNIVTGTESATAAFADFGAAIVKALVDYAAQQVALAIESKLLQAAQTLFGIGQAQVTAAAWAPAAAAASLASFGGNAAPAGAGITAVANLSELTFAKLAVGSGGFQDDTLGLFNKGEIVIPNSFSDAIRSGDLGLTGGNNQKNKQPSVGQYFDFTGAKFNGITDKLVQTIFTKASENIRAKKLTALPA